MTEHSADSSPDSATKKTFPPEKSSGKTKADSTLPSPDTGTLVTYSLASLLATKGSEWYCYGMSINCTLLQSCI